MMDGEKRLLAAFTLVGVLVRLLLLLEYTNRNPFYDHPILDSAVYLDWSQAILEDRVFFAQEYHHPPGYAFFLAAVFRITGVNYFWILFLQSLMVAGDGILVFICARKLFDQAAAWVAMILFTLCGPFVFYSMKILSETLYCTLLLLAFFTVLRYLESKKLLYGLLAGLVLGAAVEVRGNAMICIIPALAAFLGKEPQRQQARSASLFLAGILIVVLPVLTRNVVVANAWTPVASNWGENFYFANNSQATGTFSPTAGIGTNLQEQIGNVQREASRKAGRQLSSLEAQGFWFHEGLRFIVSQPLSWLRLEFLKLQRLFSFHEASSMYFYELESKYFAFWLRFLFVGYVVALLLFFAGLTVPRKSRGISLLFGFVLAQVFLMFVFWPELRFLLPLFPFLIVVAGNNFHLASELLKSRARLSVSLGGILLCLLLNLIPMKGTGGREAWFTNASAALYSRGILIPAAHMAQWGIDLNPAYAPAWVNLGTASYALGDVSGAREDWQKALKLNRDDYGTLRNLALSYEKEDPSRALAYWKNCLRAAKARSAPGTVIGDTEQKIRELTSTGTNRLE